jgi:hypothetical protein
MEVKISCKECHEDKPITDYYLINAKTPYKKCKVCTLIEKKAKYKPKGTGFKTLPEDKRKQIIDLMSDRRNKIKDVATMTGIVYATLCYWFKTNQIHE